MSDFEVYKDSDNTVTGTIIDADEAAVDITAATITWSVLKKGASFDGDLDTVAAGGSIVKATGGSGVAISDGTAGEYEVTIGDTDTSALPVEEYYVLIRCTLAGGSTPPIPRQTMNLTV